MSWALDLIDELIPLVEQWERDFPDWPAHKMISNLDISGLDVGARMSPEEIADRIAGYAEGRCAENEMLGRIERARQEEGEELSLEELLAEYLG